MRYTVRQTLVPRNVTMSTKLRGAQRAPELPLRSTKFRSPENLIFPALTTDLLQPLDVAVFKSLKQKWEAVLFKRLRKTRSALSKSEFTTIISSEKFGEKHSMLYQYKMNLRSRCNN